MIFFLYPSGIGTSESDLKNERLSPTCLLNEIEIEPFLLYKKSTTKDPMTGKEVEVVPLSSTAPLAQPETEIAPVEEDSELRGGPVDALIVKATEVSKNYKKNGMY